MNRVNLTTLENIKTTNLCEFYEEIRTKRKNIKKKSFCLSPLNHGSTSSSANNLHTVNWLIDWFERQMSSISAISMTRIGLKTINHTGRKDRSVYVWTGALTVIRKWRGEW